MLRFVLPGPLIERTRARGQGLALVGFSLGDCEGCRGTWRIRALVSTNGVDAWKHGGTPPMKPGVRLVLSSLSNQRVAGPVVRTAA